MSICRSLMGIVLDQAAKHQANRVVEVDIQVGSLRGVAPDHLKYYFDFLKKGTVADAATLNVDVVEGKAQCAGCGKHFNIAQHSYVCPCCQIDDAEVVAGVELRITTMRVE